MRVLLLEDDLVIGAFLEESLGHQGYAIDWAKDGEEGLYYVEINSYDIMLFDVMVPHIDGITLCKKVRALGIQVPILFLTAKNDLSSVVQGLDYGGDDYIAKPFELAELLARMRSNLRQKDKQSILRFDSIEFDSSKKTTQINNRPIALSQKELQLLELFMCNLGVVLSEEAIIEAIWSSEGYLQSNLLSVYIYRLRKKIGCRPQKRLIHSLKNIGYVMR